MKKLLEYDRHSGIEHWFHSNDGVHTIESKQDIQPELEASQQLRNDDDYWKKGVKNDLVHYAHIPNNILEQWLKQGVNINDTQELLRMVNLNPKFKVVNRNHGSKSSSSKLIILPKLES